MDHRGDVSRLRGDAAGAVQRRRRAKTTITCTSAGCQSRRPRRRSPASPSCSTRLRIASQDVGKEWLADVDRCVQHALPFFAVAVSRIDGLADSVPARRQPDLSRAAQLGHLVGLVFALVAVMLIRGYAVPILFVLFVLGSADQVFLAAGSSSVQVEKEPMF